MKAYAYLLLAICSLMSCASSKQQSWQNEHSNSLAYAKLSGTSSDDKLDILMKSYTKMMHQSLDFLNPKKGIAFAEKYNVQHKELIVDILEDVNDNYNSLSQVSKNS